MIWDPKDGVTETLREYELPVYSGILSMSPDLSSGIWSSQGTLSNTIYWLDIERPVELELGIDPAIRAHWSPDGKWIAFFGDPGSRGGSVLDIATRASNLLLMPTACKYKPAGCSKDDIEVLERGFTGGYNNWDQSDLTWSPDRLRRRAGEAWHVAQEHRDRETGQGSKRPLCKSCLVPGRQANRGSRASNRRTVGRAPRS